MAVNIKSLGIEAYMNRVYAEQGGYDRLVKLIELRWHDAQIAHEFGVVRQTVVYWKKLVKKLEVDSR